MRKKIYAFAIVMVLGLSQLMTVSAAESARAAMNLAGAPANVTAAAARSEGWVCDAAGNMMKNDLGDNTVLLNCLQLTTDAQTAGEYTFNCPAVTKGMVVKTYGYNSFTGMWTEIANTVAQGSVTLTVDATVTDICFIVVK